MADHPEPLTLAALALRPGVHDADDFIADTTGRIGIRSILGTTANHGPVEALRDKTVLLAMPSQRETIIALTQLDGIAKRLVLWPGGTFDGEITELRAMAGIDAIATTWPPANRPIASSKGQFSRSLPSATQWVLFTSGTTGAPKMVVHTLDSLAGHLAAPSTESDLRPVWACFYDIRRYGGLQIMLRALVSGGSLVLSDAAETPGQFLRRAAAASATHFLGTPSHWRRALMTDERHAISPAYVRLSGEVADQGILDRLAATYPSAAIVHAFASTEAGLAFEIADRQAGFPASLPADNAIADIRIVDGALHIRSARNASGTLNGTLTPLANQDGFVETGDSVALHAGRYHIVGRQDGTVNVGGQKVHPEEVEAILNQHPEVQMSRVSARANPITGAIVVADVVRRGHNAAATLTEPALSRRVEEDIRSFCRHRLPPHKVPSSVRFVSTLAVTQAGKLVRAVA